jgi:tetratricopeptide (TPR) repeat protein
LTILQELHVYVPRKLSVLLLLGCTCYSLGLHHLSVLCNEEILAIDPLFAEAFSNLGTTYRAMAQGGPAVVARWGQLLLSTARGFSASILSRPGPITQQDMLSAAEGFYRQALSIRPRYWDAAVNLAGLLTAQNRYEEAIGVYITLETAFEKGVDSFERFSNKEPAGPEDFGDRAFVQALQAAERRRTERKSVKMNSGPRIKDAKSSWDNTDTRKDLYYAKGNLYYVLGQSLLAKKEYLKALVVSGLDIARVMDSCHPGILPAAPIGPTEVLMVAAAHQQKTGSPTKGKSGSAGSQAGASVMLQTLAKIYQDSAMTHFAVAFYYMSLSHYREFASGLSCRGHADV